MIQRQKNADLFHFLFIDAWLAFEVLIRPRSQVYFRNGPVSIAALMSTDDFPKVS